MRRLAALALLLSAFGCGSPDNAPGQSAITVFAAASLKGTFTEIGRQFEAENEDVTVTFSFAGSADLAAQLQQGAPADVFASADAANMTKAIDDDLVSYVADFATNRLQIATPPGNPAGIGSFGDLADDDVKVVLCAAQVPCGAAAAAVEKAAGIDIEPVSEEQSVTDVLGKVISGEADAGLVYVTDVKAARDRVNGVPFPEAGDAVNTYPIAALKRADEDGLAEAFISFVTGREGQAVLSPAGFGKP